MKYTFLFIVGFFIACTQSVDSPINNDVQISYDLGGNHYAYSSEQTNAVKIWHASAAAWFYSIAATDGSANSVQVLVITDTLQTISYHFTKDAGTGGIILSENHNTCGLISSSDYLDLTITSYQSGIVNGTFSGMVTNISSMTQQPVRGGEIKNISMRY